MIGGAGECSGRRQRSPVEPEAEETGHPALPQVQQRKVRNAHTTHLAPTLLFLFSAPSSPQTWNARWNVPYFLWNCLMNPSDESLVERVCKGEAKLETSEPSDPHIQAEQSLFYSTFSHVAKARGFLLFPE